MKSIWATAREDVTPEVRKSQRIILTEDWLEVIAELKWLSLEKMKPEYEECSELLAIFSSIGKK